MHNISEKGMNEFPILQPEEGIPLFYPFIAPEAKDEILDTLSSRWIGQGPKVDKFENLFKKMICPNNYVVATGSGTDSLHLAYILAGIKEGDEVITPVFTCTATNLPILYERAKPIFADIDPETMNINVDDIEHRITSRTKAIVSVDYGGIPADYINLKKIAVKYNLKLISDSAQSLGSKIKGKSPAEYADFTTYSFQAIKTITTADGGLLSIKDKKLYDLAKRIRWFGIDRKLKQKGTWENDIKEIGFKYQMTDLSACLGISGLKHLDRIILKRKELFKIYHDNIDHHDVKLIYPNKDLDFDIVPWLCTVLVNRNRYGLMKKLRENGIESAQVHYRNDRYSVFGKRLNNLTNMNSLEDKYLVLPLHHMMRNSDCLNICKKINEGWE